MMSVRRRSWLMIGMAVLMIGILVWQQWDSTVDRVPPFTGDDGAVAESALPPEARETLRLIDEGGPFPYPEDGSVFGNREGLLPAHEEGYYREFTVETPGSEDRGARRIVVGDGGEWYWTADHYASFVPIERAP